MESWLMKIDYFYLQQLKLLFNKILYNMIFKKLWIGECRKTVWMDKEKNTTPPVEDLWQLKKKDSYFLNHKRDV